MALRVFIGVVEIAGYYSALAQGLRELGVDSSFVCTSDNPFRYEESARTNNLVIRALHYGLKRRAAVTRKQIFAKLFWIAFTELCRAAVFLWVAARHQVFVFGFGTSFYGFRELPLLKALGRRVICVYNGSDSRPPYIDGALLHFDPRLASDSHWLYRKTLAVKRLVRRADRHADVIVSAPPQALFESRPFVLFQAVGIPVHRPSAATRAMSLHGVSTTTRILHCPSVPEAKGTPLIRGAIESLRQRGFAIDYVEVTGQPNAVVLQEIARCDFVVDHLYSDSPAGTFVAEAAFFGKPAILAGYCQPFVDTIPPDCVPPTVYCTPSEIETKIERLIVDVKMRREIGERARMFVERNWTPIEFAKRFLLLIEDKIPTRWICDPYRIDFVPVAGMSEAKARDVIARLIQAHGRSALQLQDKPWLQDIFVEFADTGRRGRASRSC